MKIGGLVPLLHEREPPPFYPSINKCRVQENGGTGDAAASEYDIKRTRLPNVADIFVAIHLTSMTDSLAKQTFLHQPTIDPGYGYRILTHQSSSGSSHPLAQFVFGCACDSILVLFSGQFI
jgi:hypothetical protein